MYSEITTSKIIGSVADPQTVPLGIDECVLSKQVSLIAIGIILYAIIEDRQHSLYIKTYSILKHKHYNI